MSVGHEVDVVGAGPSYIGSLFKHSPTGQDLD